MRFSGYAVFSGEKMAEMLMPSRSQPPPKRIPASGLGISRHALEKPWSRELGETRHTKASRLSETLRRKRLFESFWLVKLFCIFYLGPPSQEGEESCADLGLCPVR